MKKIFEIAALALAVGAGAGYLSRDIQADHEMTARKLQDIERLRHAYGCDVNPSAGTCTSLDFEREQITTGYSIGGTPG
jgi:hypothetical protein